MFDGCSLKCAGGSLEVLGNDVPRWMAAAYGQCLWEQNPAYGWLIYRFCRYERESEASGNGKFS